MKKIASFTVNHIDLLTGIYVSRKDSIGEEVATTFDLRFTRPNVEPVMVTSYKVCSPDMEVSFKPAGCLLKFRTTI